MQQLLRTIIVIIAVAMPLPPAASETAPLSTLACPAPTTLKEFGIPAGFEFYFNDGVEEADFSKVYGFDTVRFDQQSASISEDNIAEADFAICLYDNSIINEEGGMPFYMIRTIPNPEGGGSVQVNIETPKWVAFAGSQAGNKPAALLFVTTTAMHAYFSNN